MIVWGAVVLNVVDGSEFHICQSTVLLVKAKEIVVAPLHDTTLPLYAQRCFRDMIKGYVSLRCRGFSIEEAAR